MKHDFVIDQNELKKKFRQIQTSVHPDKYGLHDERVQKMADDHSSFANHAYKTLSDTRQRALYMLEISNVGESSPDPELAMQMMELNEEIEENDDVEELKTKLKEIEEHINDIVHTMSSHFEERKAEKAKKDLDRLRFYDRTKKLILKKLQ
uniref:J domain-containing protein n=1 Tax=Panagrolaimus superbus TaxID=310955 RepID=A0A914ZB78_9BILA